MYQNPFAFPQTSAAWPAVYGQQYAQQTGQTGQTGQPQPTQPQQRQVQDMGYGQQSYAQSGNFTQAQPVNNAQQNPYGAAAQQHTGQAMAWGQQQTTSQTNQCGSWNQQAGQWNAWHQASQQGQTMQSQYQPQQQVAQQQQQVQPTQQQQVQPTQQQQYTQQQPPAQYQPQPYQPQQSQQQQPAEQYRQQPQQLMQQQAQQSMQHQAQQSVQHQAQQSVQHQAQQPMQQQAQHSIQQQHYGNRNNQIERQNTNHQNYSYTSYQTQSGQQQNYSHDQNAGRSGSYNQHQQPSPQRQHYQQKPQQNIQPLMNQHIASPNRQGSNQRQFQGGPQNNKQGNSQGNQSYQSPQKQWANQGKLFESENKQWIRTPDQRNVPPEPARPPNHNYNSTSQNNFNKPYETLPKVEAMVKQPPLPSQPPPPQSSAMQGNNHAPPPPPPSDSVPPIAPKSLIATTTTKNETSDNESLLSLQDQLKTLETQIRTYQSDYQKWHQDFVKWQKQHQNHPDQKQYIDYQKKYQKMIEEQQGQLKKQYAELQKKISLRKADQKSAGAAKIAALKLGLSTGKADSPDTEQAKSVDEATSKEGDATKTLDSKTESIPPMKAAISSAPPVQPPAPLPQQDGGGVTETPGIMLRPANEYVGVHCRFFPRCKNGNKCKFEHPMCQTAERCIDPACPYEHPKNRNMVALKKNEGKFLGLNKPDPAVLLRPGPSNKPTGDGPKDSFSMAKVVNTLTKRGDTQIDGQPYPKPLTSEPVREGEVTSGNVQERTRAEDEVTRKRQFLSQPYAGELPHDGGQPAKRSMQSNENSRPLPLMSAGTGVPPYRERMLPHLPERSKDITGANNDIANLHMKARVDQIYEKRRHEILGGGELPPHLSVDSEYDRRKREILGGVSDPLRPDPMADEYERRRRLILDDPYPEPQPPLLGSFEGDRLSQHPIGLRDDPIRRLEPPLRDPYLPSLYRDPYYDRFDRDLDRRDPYPLPPTRLIERDSPYPLPPTRLIERDSPYPLPPTRSIDRKSPYTIDYGHRRADGPDPVPYDTRNPLERERFPDRPVDQRRSLDERRDLFDLPRELSERREFIDRYRDSPARDIHSRPLDPLDRPREPYDPLREPIDRYGDPLDPAGGRYREPIGRPRDPLDRLRNPYDRSKDSYDRPRDLLDRYKDTPDRPRNRYDSRDKYPDPLPSRSAPSEYLRRIEERERERNDREGMRDFEMLYKKDPGSPVESRRSAISREPRIPESELKPEIIPAGDILDKPGRDRRPKNIVIILRGIPGSGKSYIARLIKDKEAYYGAQPPRILALDDYFMQDVEKSETPSSQSKSTAVKKQEYIFESDMEEAYRGSLLKAFNKTLTDGFFPMVIVDAINDKGGYFDQFWSDAKHKGFEVFIAELHGEVDVCLERSIHKRPKAEVQKMLDKWEKAPVYYKRLDVSELLQDAAIDDVEMEEAAKEMSKDEASEKKAGDDEEDEELPSSFHIPKSKWESSKAETLAKLDGITKRKLKGNASPIFPDEEEEEDDPYGEKEADMRLGKKRVRWLDLEQKKQIDHQRKIGFSIGMDWNILTDPNAQIPKY